MIQIATIETVRHVFENLDPGDRREAELFYGEFNPEKAIENVMGYCNGCACVCRADDGEPIAIAGIIDDAYPDSVAWAVSTPRFQEKALEIIRTCKQQVELTLARGRSIHAFSWDHNPKGVRWLESLKFKPGEALMFGGEPFTLYQRVS